MSDSDVSRRKFFMHSAHKTIGVSAGLAALQTCDLSQFVTAGETQQVLRVLLISDCPSHKSDDSLAVLEEHLTQRYHVRCGRVFATIEDETPGLERLDDCDCAVLFMQRMKVDGEPLQRIKRYCRRGGAVVGVRTSSHGLGNWLDMDEGVFGGDYQGHYGNKITDVKIVEAAENHPILQGVRPFCSHGALDRNPNIAKNTTLLLTGEFSDHKHAVAWTREPYGGRVFYTSLGHPADFGEPDFLRLLSNALLWACCADE